MVISVNRQYWVVAILVFGKPDYFINNDILLITNVGNMKLLVHSINTYQEFNLFLALFMFGQYSSGERETKDKNHINNKYTIVSPS